MVIQFNNIKNPSDLTVWYTDDKELSAADWLQDALPEGVNFEVSHHPEEMRLKLHARVSGDSLTKHNFFISDGDMKFSTTKWDTKPDSPTVQDHYHGSLDVIKAYEPQLLGKGGHYFTAVYSSAFDDNPVNPSQVNPDEFKLDLPNSSFNEYGNFKNGGPTGIMTSSKSDEDPTDRFVSMILYFDKLIGLAA